MNYDIFQLVVALISVILIIVAIASNFTKRTKKHTTSYTTTENTGYKMAMTSQLKEIMIRYITENPEASDTVIPIFSDAELMIRNFSERELNSLIRQQGITPECAMLNILHNNIFLRFKKKSAIEYMRSSSYEEDLFKFVNDIKLEKKYIDEEQHRENLISIADIFPSYGPPKKTNPNKDIIIITARELAAKTVTWMSSNKDKYSDFLKHSALTEADSAIFAFYMVQIFSLSIIEDDDISQLFLSTYTKAFFEYAEEAFQSNTDFDFKQMFNNRTEFYNRVFGKKDDFDDSMAAVIEEFQLIIKTDIVRNYYIDYSESSPLAIIDFSDDVLCWVECMDFYKSLPDLLLPFLRKIESLDNSNEKSFVGADEQKG